MSLNELLQQKAELERQISEQTREQRAAAIAEIKSLMLTYGLTPGDIVPDAEKIAKAGKKSSRAGAKVEPKYRDAHGHTWTGRGLKPNWLRAALHNGATLEQFAI